MTPGHQRTGWPRQSYLKFSTGTQVTSKYPNVHWRSQVFESWGGGGIPKTGLTGGLSRALYAWVWPGIQGAFPSPRKKLNLWLVEMQFPAVLRGLLSLFSLLLVNILSRSQFLPTLPTLTTSMQICTNYDTHISFIFVEAQGTSVLSATQQINSLNVDCCFLQFYESIVEKIVRFNRV